MWLVKEAQIFQWICIQHCQLCQYSQMYHHMIEKSWLPYSHAKSSDICILWPDTLWPLEFSNQIVSVFQRYFYFDHHSIWYDSIGRLYSRDNVQVREHISSKFFDSMEQLPIQLPNKNILCGPLQFRWMYPFKIFLGDIKQKWKNKAYPEWSICLAYLGDEIAIGHILFILFWGWITYVSQYLDPIGWHE